MAAVFTYIFIDIRLQDSYDTPFKTLVDSHLFKHQEIQFQWKKRILYFCLFRQKNKTFENEKDLLTLFRNSILIVT